ncbi:hypothetical protein TWF594_008518 [Orbilia oligospora]|nr:hypothetical protein TWF594_008518 [Orbilia oligospora]
MSETCGDNTDWTALPGRGFLNYNKTHSLGVLVSNSSFDIVFINWTGLDRTGLDWTNELKHRDDNHKTTTTTTTTMMTMTMPIMVTATATVTTTGETEKLRTKKVLYAKCPTTPSSYLRYRTDLNHSD